MTVTDMKNLLSQPATERSVTTKLAIEVEGISKSYGSNRVLRGLSLQVLEGAKVTIVGPNGAGKTTLLKILATISKPSRGTARIAGLDILQESLLVRRQIGVISHQPYIY